MFRPLLVQVGSVGEHVVLEIGNVKWTFHYETALLLSDWMRRRGRESKQVAGNHSMLFGCQGTLHDASKGVDYGQPFTPGKVFTVCREVLPKEQVAVRSNGSKVDVTLGSITATITYKAALQLAQWIRLKAKESKRRASDTARHWSQVAQAHIEQQGPLLTQG